MRFPGVAGQERAFEALTRAFASGRFHPSLIFHGPQGVGKLTSALALAKALACTATDDPPCGLCSACRRIDARSLRHPDVRVVLPETTDDYRRGEVAAEGVSGIDVQDRQATALLHPAWGVLIDRVRDGIAFANRRPSEGTRAILIIDQAHRMGAEAANALLKTLEEPPEHAVLVLLTTSLHALLPTLRSRCQAIPFRSIPPETVARVLTAEHGVPPEEARLRALLCGGRIGAALELDLASFRERREAMLRLLESFLRPPDPGLAVARAEDLAKGGDATEADLEILATLLRDRMILEAAGDEAGGLIHADLRARLRTLALRPHRDGTGALLALESALDGLRRRGNRQLLIENLLLDLLPDRAATAPRPGP